MTGDDDRIRRAFHARYDGLQARPGAADRAFDAVAAAGGEAGHGPGRRLAGAFAVAVAVVLVITLVITRQALTAPRTTSPAARPVMPAVYPQSASAPLANRPRPEIAVALNSSVVIVGWSASGEMRLTEDGGQTWRTVRPANGSPMPLFDLQFVDADDALAATGTGLFRYQLSTGAWTQLSTRSDLVRLDFSDLDMGYAVTQAGDLVMTTDGGRTVAKQDAGIHPVTWVQWVTPTRGWVAGPQGISATVDGGNTWTRQLSVPDSGPGVITWAQIGFRDTANGFAILDVGGAVAGRQAYAVYHTADSGVTWTAESCTCGALPVPDWLRQRAHATLLEEAHGDLLVTGPSSAMLVTTSPAPAAAISICTTADAGRDWSCGSAPFGSGGTAALAARGGTWWLVAMMDADGQMSAVTRDGGLTWTTVPQS
jgi:photosystem II stability/assembly factor-like uncharacterized protein